MQDALREFLRGPALAEEVIDRMSADKLIW